ncbi:methyltransferase [Aureococcus anophagefferens]|nr:methyltransferase [Aureococcus anophagefferens]
MPSVVNEFGAMPAAPDACDLRLVDLGGGEAMVEVHTSGGAQRSGVDIEIVLDVSGSMATESEVQDAAGNVQRHGFSTLDVCKHAARCVACSLDDTCRLGLVAYDAQARVVVGLARVTPAHVAKVHAALEKLAPGTSTNLWGGLELGVDELVGGAGDNARAVLLLTDGVPNNSPPEGEVAALRAKRLTKDGSRPSRSSPLALVAAGATCSCRRAGRGLFSFVPDAGMVGTSFNHLVASLRSSAAVAAAVVADGAVVATSARSALGEARGGVARGPPDLVGPDAAGEIAAYGLLGGPGDGDAARLASYVVDLESQIRIACSRDAFFDRWGAHYVRSLRSAHETATRHNFKDASVDTYFGAPASTLLAVADAAFAKLPAPKPSKQGRAGPRDMSSAYNSRCNGCVSGGSLVVRYGDRAPDAVVAGDVLLDATGGPATVQCVVATAVERGFADLVRVGPVARSRPGTGPRRRRLGVPADLGAEARVPATR